MQIPFIEIAKVGAPHGLEGDLRLHILSESIEKALAYGQWYIQKNRSSEWKPLDKEEIYRNGNKIFIHFSGANTPESARVWTNALIGVPREAIGETNDPDEFYWVDLLGMRVSNGRGDDFGVVTDILETGANEVLICQKDKLQTLIPFVKKHVIKVDSKQKTIKVDWEYDY